MKDRINNLIDFIKRNPIPSLLFLVIIINSIRSYGSISEWFYYKILIIPGIVIGITCHEASHAFASYKLGDMTPKYQGRLTLNPLAHIDLSGLLFLFICGFGWGKPVQIDSRSYKNERTGNMIVSISGVVANFLVAFVLTFIYALLSKVLTQSLYDGVLGILYDMLYYAIYINVMLIVFNLLPCPPLDGWNFISSLFNLQKYSWWYKVNSYSNIILLAVILLNIPDKAISFFAGKIINLLSIIFF